MTLLPPTVSITHTGGSFFLLKKTLLTPHVESPDLGAFTIVFRALNDFQQPRNFIPHAVAPTTTITATSAMSRTESESDPNNRGSTVWNQHPIASYLSVASRTTTTRHSAASPPPTEPPSSDTEGEIMIDVDSGEYDDSNDADEDTLPSLGYLDEALQFIAAERAKLTAPRDNSWHRSQSATSDDPPRGRQQLQQRRRQQQQQQQPHPRRKRRRAKARSLGRTIGAPDSAPSFGHSGAVDAEILDGDDASDFLSPSPSPDISSSELAVRFKSTPASPPRRKARHRVRSASADTRPRLGHSQSTPTLRSGPLDPRVVRLRALAIKLKFLFAAEAELLTAILSNQSLQSPSPGFIDPRGPAPNPGQPLVHVFID